MLADEEQPLLVQLNWHKDDREGRFLLRRMDETTYVSHSHNQPVNTHHLSLHTFHRFPIRFIAPLHFLLAHYMCGCMSDHV